MELALLGGTGRLGEGLALRFGRDTDVDLWIGSRDAAKAADAAAAYEEILANRGVDRSITGTDNETATRHCDVVVLSVPPYYAADTVESVEDELDGATTLLSPAVGMTGDTDGLHYNPPSVGSVTELIAETAPGQTPVVGACTNLSGDRLADLDASVDMDTLVFGDDPAAKGTITDLLTRLDGIRPLDVGPLANAAEVEALTPLLINVAEYNDDLHELGVRFV